MKEKTNPDDLAFSIYSGLTKREYAAIAALQGLLSFPGYSETPLAALSVRYADELIDALNNGPEAEDLTSTHSD